MKTVKAFTLLLFLLNTCAREEVNQYRVFLKRTSAFIHYSDSLIASGISSHHTDFLHDILRDSVERNISPSIDSLRRETKNIRYIENLEKLDIFPKLYSKNFRGAAEVVLLDSLKNEVKTILEKELGG